MPHFTIFHLLPYFSRFIPLHQNKSPKEQKTSLLFLKC
jgi:hypothetical protein